MKKIILSAFLCCVGVQSFCQKHPICYVTESDVQKLKINLNLYALLKQSYTTVKKQIDEVVKQDIDVPVPKDAQGGYTHDRHKQNYTLMFNAGLLYQITKDTTYANFVKKILLKYALLNPTLKNHPQATSSSPGRIFWQALNDANWLVYAGMAYDLIHNYVSTADKKIIEQGAFKPEVDFFTKDLESWFNLIHNHGVWACAGVGIVGIATNNKQYVNMALYGTKNDGKSGFIAQLNQLFSPDGYYTEGPYYVRYALLPFYAFANAINNYQPQLNIFKARGAILQKALLGGLQQTNLDGGFYSYNDALKDKTYVTNEIVESINIYTKVYGLNNDFLPIVKAQSRVTLSLGGMMLAKSISETKNTLKYYPYKSIAFTDGINGDKGGLAILRTGQDEQLMSLIVKYSSHGLSHGHYDKLNINLYDGVNEILTDYGAVRYIGVEQKYGGRYLPETKSYASQTVAHNTLVVDEKSHFNGIESTSEQFNSHKRDIDLLGKHVKSISVTDSNAYAGVIINRTLVMCNLPQEKKPLILDFVQAISDSTHQYDLPYHFNGTFISSSQKLKTFQTSLKNLGIANGYQHLWKEAEAKVLKTGNQQFTFLQGKTFYTISSWIKDSADILFARSGATDPNFNLRREPCYVLRKKGKQIDFINFIEIHGNYDPIYEFSTDAYSQLAIQQVIEDEVNHCKIIEATYRLKPLIIILAMQQHPSSQTTNNLTYKNRTISFTGSTYIEYDSQPLK